MKRLLALLAAAFLLLSCGNTEADDPFFDLYLLTEISEAGGRTPAKFNASTGTLTSLCADPLCMHTNDSGCPFARMTGEVTYHDGCLYFWKEILPSESPTDMYDSALMGYDMDDASLREVVRRSTLEQIFLDNGYSVSSWSQGIRCGCLWTSLNNSTGTGRLVTIRVDLETGKRELLSGDHYMPLCEYTEGRYFGVTESGPMVAASPGFVIAGFNGENPEYHLTEKNIAITFWDKMDGDTLLYAEIGKTDDGWWDWEHMTLFAYNIKTGENTTVLEPFPDVYFAQIGDWIYYTPYLEEPIFLGVEKHSGQEKYNKTGGILQRVNIRTGERKPVFEMPEYNLIGTEIDAVGQYVVVSYHNIDYENYETEMTEFGEAYTYEKEYGRIVYNTSTGETKIYPEA
ncbi:MAG: hypothetical protein IJF78_13950 [Clostridia bacterium]|nr:hypothetical protein [Clostridia bacterium]